MAEHEHGSMNTTTQEKTFDGFLKMVSRATIVILLLVILMALVNA